MIRLNQEVSLAGRLEKITISELRSKPGEVFQSVILGKTYLVTQRGKTIAVIGKPPGVELSICVGRKGEINYKLP